MVATKLQTVVHRLRRLAIDRELSDEELLERFLATSDQLAFEMLVRRHGPMVWDVCRRRLPQHADADDACQAVFLVLARQARSIRCQRSLAAWLHGVACRVAEKARRDASSRRRRELQAKEARLASDPSDAVACRELCRLLDEELCALSEATRTPLVLCYLQGLTRDRAAQRLGCSLRTLDRRLERGRELLRARLQRRGVTLSAGLLLAGLTQARASSWPTRLLPSIVQSAAGGVAVSSSVASLAETAVRSLMPVKTPLAIMVLATAVLATVLGAFAYQARPAQPTQPPATEQAAHRQSRLDRYGDPLPTDAVARFGTVRFRHSAWVEDLAWSGDGKRVICPDVRSAIVWDVATGRKVRRLKTSNSWVYCAAYGPRGQRVATGGSDRIIRIWDLSTGRQVRQLQGHWPPQEPIRDGVAQLCFTADGSRLVSRGFDNTLRLWDIATGVEQRQFMGYRAPLWKFALSRDGKTLAAFAKPQVNTVNGNQPGEVWRWDVATGKPLSHWLLPDDVGIEEFSPDTTTLATTWRDASGPQGLKLWDTSTATVRRMLPIHPYAATFGANGRTVITLNKHFVSIWDVATGKEQHRLPSPYNAVFAKLSCSPDGRTLAWTNDDNTVRFSDLRTGKAIHQFEGHEKGVAALAFSPDGRTLASGADEDLYLWDVNGHLAGRHFHGDLSFITDLAFAPDGRTLFVGTGNRGVHAWDCAAGRDRGRVGPQTTCMGLAADGRRMVLVYLSGHLVQLWDTTGPKFIRSWPVDTQPWCPCTLHGSNFAINPSDGSLAAAGSFGAILRWDAAGQRLPDVRGTRYWVTAVAFSPDGRLLAGVDNNKTIRLWDVATGRQRIVIDTGGNVSTVAFSPTGWLLAVAHEDRDSSRGVDSARPEDRNCVDLIEVATGQVVHHFTGHQGGVRALAFSPDGTRLASASEDTTVLLWDVAGALRGGPTSGTLSQQRLEQLWNDLASPTAARAQAAVAALADAPRQSVPFLAQRVALPAPRVHADITPWLRDLDDRQFRVRERATRQLEKLGEPIRDPLQQALEKHPSPEARRRLEQVLSRLNHASIPAWSLDDLRSLRAIAVLERAGKSGRAALEALVGRAASSPVRDAAQAALKRLDRASIRRSRLPLLWGCQRPLSMVGINPRPAPSFPSRACGLVPRPDQAHRPATAVRGLPLWGVEAQHVDLGPLGLWAGITPPNTKHLQNPPYRPKWKKSGPLDPRPNCPAIPRL